MGLLECASVRSISRGYDYFTHEKVQELHQLTKAQYSARVAGSAAAPYAVFIDTAHPRKSKCSCPHAAGRRIICKHMLSVYFTVFPDEAQRIYEARIAREAEDAEHAYDEWDDCEEYEEFDDYDEYDNGEEDAVDLVTKRVRKMTRSELQQALLQILSTGPEWQYDRFIDEYCLRYE